MSKPEIILCDIDGTVADISHRLHYISNEINIGDIVKPKDIHNAKEYRGKVISRNSINQVTDVDWEGNVPPIVKAYGYYEGWQLKKVKSWRKFFEACDKDTPIQTTIDIVKTLYSKWSVIFCSGRPETYRKQTINWLFDNYGWNISQAQPVLIMRPENDTRQDYIVKEELYLKYIEPRYHVKAVFDDRAQVVSMWRRLGLQCYQVAEGKF